MFNKPIEQRMVAWREFRDQLENAEHPFNDVVAFYSHAPLVRIQADAWDQSTWPGPWELLDDNLYCDFVKILAICYTLQLTERFSLSHFEIHITQDKEQTRYLLTVDGHCIGYGLNPIDVKDLPSNLVFEKTFVMPPLQ